MTEKELDEADIVIREDIVNYLQSEIYFKYKTVLKLKKEALRARDFSRNEEYNMLLEKMDKLRKNLENNEKIPEDIYKESYFDGNTVY